MNSPDSISPKSTSESIVKHGFSPQLSETSSPSNSRHNFADQVGLPFEGEESDLSINDVIAINTSMNSSKDDSSSHISPVTTSANSRNTSITAVTVDCVSPLMFGPSTSNSIKRQMSNEDVILIEDEDQARKCCICRQLFADNLTLQIHLKCHIGDKPFKCTYCSKSFSHDSHLQMHLKIHLGIKPYECSYCNKSFIQKGNLQSHLRTHNGQRPFQCEFCNKCFTQKGNLQTHIKLHYGDKPFACPLCGKRFNQNGNLQSHIRCHDDQKPYKCDVCLKTYSQKSNLEIHMWSHNGTKPFPCHVCEKSFVQKSSLMAHIKLHESKPDQDQRMNGLMELNYIPQLPVFSMPSIGETAFPTPLNILCKLSNMANNADNKTNCNPDRCICLSCQNTFQNDAELKNHAKHCNNKQGFTCVICFMSFPDDFSLQTHLVTHSVAVEQVFRCQICKMSFDSSEAIKEHIESHSNDL